jgi:hypothetical protein
MHCHDFGGRGRRRELGSEDEIAEVLGPSVVQVHQIVSRAKTHAMQDAPKQAGEACADLDVPAVRRYRCCAESAVPPRVTGPTEA